MFNRIIQRIDGLFELNGYNPVTTIKSKIHAELASSEFQNWLSLKGQKDIQTSIDIAIGAIAGFIEAANYCYNQGKLACDLLGTAADDIKITGLGSAVYKAGRMAFESGALFRRQYNEGFYGINPHAIAQVGLELQPPTPSYAVEPIAIALSPSRRAIALLAPAPTAKAPMSFKAWVMWVTRQTALEAAIEPHTKRTLKGILHKSGKEVKGDRRSDFIRAIVAG